MTEIKTDSGLTLLRNDIHIPGTDKFVVADYFKEGEDTNGVPIWLLGTRFKQKLFHREEKNIKPITSGCLYRIDRKLSNKLGFDYLNDTIMVKLHHFHEYLKVADKLGGWYVSYIADGLAVFAFWRSISNGWDIEAYPVKILSEWPIAHQVQIFSGNLGL